jgi:adenosine deaminase
MKNFDTRYNQLPKTEIHCHLEGAIRTQTIIDIAQERGLVLPAYTSTELDRYIKVREQLKDLQTVLDAFAIFQNSIISAAAVERISAEVFEDAAAQNIKLFEARFSPDWAFSGHQLNWDESLEAVLSAKQAAEEKHHMAIGLIAITSRGMGLESCDKTVDWAIRHRDQIQGIDLADAEWGHPIREFVRPIQRAKEAGLKITIHTGEDTPASFVMDTIRLGHPDRIGHGIHIIEDPAAIELVKSEDVTLEVNPWSNYLTNSVPRIEDHPLKRLFDLGVRVTINSDDPEVLDTNLNNEYRIAHEILGMSMDEIMQCNRFAVEASFLPENTKQAVLKTYFS